MAKELRGSSPTTTRYETEAEREHSHLRRLRLGDLSVLGARMGLWPSAREGQSPILVPNTPALLDTRKKEWLAPQPCQHASADHPVPQTSRPNPRVSVGREVSAMRIPPTLPLPRANSALRVGVRRWGIRFRAQRSEHGNGPPAAAGIMSTATSERGERGERARRASE